MSYGRVRGRFHQRTAPQQRRSATSPASECPLRPGRRQTSHAVDQTTPRPGALVQLTRPAPRAPGSRLRATSRSSRSARAATGLSARRVASSTRANRSAARARGSAASGADPAPVGVRPEHALDVRRLAVEPEQVAEVGERVAGVRELPVQHRRHREPGRVEDEVLGVEVAVHEARPRNGVEQGLCLDRDLAEPVELVDGEVRQARLAARRRTPAGRASQGSTRSSASTNMPGAEHRHAAQVGREPAERRSDPAEPGGVEGREQLVAPRALDEGRSRALPAGPRRPRPAAPPAPRAPGPAPAPAAGPPRRPRRRPRPARPAGRRGRPCAPPPPRPGTSGRTSRRAGAPARRSPHVDAASIATGYGSAHGPRHIGHHGDHHGGDAARPAGRRVHPHHARAGRLSRWPARPLSRRPRPAAESLRRRG